MVTVIAKSVRQAVTIQLNSACRYDDSQGIRRYLL